MKFYFVGFNDDGQEEMFCVTLIRYTSDYMEVDFGKEVGIVSGHPDMFKWIFPTEEEAWQDYNNHCAS